MNAQHDCERGGCQPVQTLCELQEREETERWIWTIEHGNEEHFIVNMHNLHHPHMLRKLFKADLHVVPQTEDRKSLHYKLAGELRKSAPKDVDTEDEDQSNTIRKRRKSGKSTKQGKDARNDASQGKSG